MVNKKFLLDLTTNIQISKAIKLTNILSEPIIKENNIGYSLDISHMPRSEIDEVKYKIESAIKANIPSAKITIVETSPNKDGKIKSSKSKIHLDNVKKIILVASCKGGVGKSSMSALLAKALAEKNKQVGILDADLYGPSQPHIFAAHGKAEIEDGKMLPKFASNVELNSIGFLTKPGASVNWRGPMASKALYQLLSLTKWGHNFKARSKEELDFLIIDMPPGTGDINLSLLENYHIDEAIIVTTPQEIAKIDVKKAIDQYNKFNLNIFAIIENMAFLYNSQNPSDKTQIIFPKGSSDLVTNDCNSILCEVPLVPDFAKAIDESENIEKYTHFLQNIVNKLIK